MKDQLFYDGLCPLCAKEIRLMKKHCANHIEFIDIHESSAPNKEALLKNLHIQLASGQWLVGPDANIHAWSYTKFGRLLACLRWPLIKQCVDFIYYKWADRRYQKRYGCQTCQ